MKLGMVKCPQCGRQALAPIPDMADRLVDENGDLYVPMDEHTWGRIAINNHRVNGKGEYQVRNMDGTWSTVGTRGHQ